MVDDVVQLSRLKAEAKGLHLCYSVDPTVSDWRTGDADRLYQVLHNLISNAMKFTGEGRIDVEVTPAPSENADGLIRFAVTDTGPGIPGEELDRILEPFAQVWGTDADRGSGLGLPISDRLVKAMGGEGLAVASLEGHGSTFYFTVPLPEAESQGRTPMHLGKNTESASQRMVLVVDDNQTNQLLVEAQLKKLGYDCELASNGAEALDRLESGSFDVVLMDCNMPTMDGYEATRRIRARERGTGDHIPVWQSRRLHRLNRDASRGLGWTASYPDPAPVETRGRNRSLRRRLVTSTASGSRAAMPNRAGPGRHPGPRTYRSATHRTRTGLVAEGRFRLRQRNTGRLAELAGWRPTERCRRRSAHAHAIRWPARCSRCGDG